MEQNEEKRNNETEQLQENNANQTSTNETFDAKTIITAIIMLMLMGFGLISVFLVPGMYHEIKTLKAENASITDMKGIADNMETLQKFSNYVDSIDTSNGLSADEVLSLEEEYLKFFMLEMLVEEQVSVYVEEKVVKVLESALENTTDENIQSIIEELLETHKEVLAGKTDELRELEDMFIGIENTEKALDDLLGKGDSI